MDANNQDLPGPDDNYRSPRRAIALIFVALIVASAAVYGIYRMTSNRDGEDAASNPTSVPNVVASDTDEVVTEIRQEPSLRLFEEEATVYVENDGNVTMSGVEVRDGAGAAACDLGTISPGDRQPCAAASDALSPITAVGSGPQGQAVETGLE